MKANFFTRSLTAKLFLVLAATLYFSTPSQAFFFWGPPVHHFKHFKHIKHVKHAKAASGAPGGMTGNTGTSFGVQRGAAVVACATISVVVQAGLNGNQPLSIGKAHGTAAGCFLPFLGEWRNTGGGASHGAAGQFPRGRKAKSRAWRSREDSNFRPSV